MSSLCIGVDIRSLLDTHSTGVGQYTYGLLDALFEQDKKNDYILFYNSGQEVSGRMPHWEHGNVSMVAERYPNKIFQTSLSVFRFPKLDTLIQKKTGKKIDLWFNPNIAKITTLSSAPKKVSVIHDTSFRFFPDHYTYKDRCLHKAARVGGQSRLADAILTPSESTKRDVMRLYGIDASKIHVIYPGVSQHEPPKDEKIATVKKKFNLPDAFIFYLGTIEPRKNIISLVEAFSKLSSELQTSNIELIIAGAPGWKNRDIHTAIAAQKNVRYIGYVTREEKNVLYALASLFVYPSLYEGFGFPVLEAMAAGTPVITSNRSSLPEISGCVAHLINPYNVEELFRAMHALLTDDRLQGYYKEKGIERAALYTWERAARQTLEVFKQVANS